MVLAQKDIKSDGKTIHLKQLFTKCPVNQRNLVLKDPAVAEHWKGQAESGEHCVRECTSPDEGLWESLEGSSLVLIKLRRDMASVLCCSFCTA